MHSEFSNLHALTMLFGSAETFDAGWPNQLSRANRVPLRKPASSRKLGDATETWLA